LTSLDQLPPLQQVVKEDVQGGMLPEMQALEGELQSNLTPAMPGAGSEEHSRQPSSAVEALQAETADASLADSESLSTPASQESDAEILSPETVSAVPVQDETASQSTQEPNDESALPQ
jgi:segregation and condensation protein B